jgi:hypothetical protein
MSVAADESVNTYRPVADVFTISDDYMTRLAYCRGPASADYGKSPCKNARILANRPRNARDIRKMGTNPSPKSGRETVTVAPVSDTCLASRYPPGGCDDAPTSSSLHDTSEVAEPTSGMPYPA